MQLSLKTLKVHLLGIAIKGCLKVKVMTWLFLDQIAASATEKIKKMTNWHTFQNIQYQILSHGIKKLQYEFQELESWLMINVLLSWGENKEATGRKRKEKLEREKAWEKKQAVCVHNCHITNLMSKFKMHILWVL